MAIENRFNFNENVISIAVNQPDTMAKMTTVLKEYIKECFPGVYTFSMIGHPETLSLILPELIFSDLADGKMRTALLSFVNDEGVEIMVRVVSYINFKIGNLHLEPIKNGRLYDYTPITYSIRDYGEYRNNELFKMEKMVDPTTKEELVATIQMLIFMHDLDQENICLLILGHPRKLTKLFPGIKFISIRGMLYTFMVTTIERIRIDCIARYDVNESEPLQIVIFKQQNA